MELSIVTPLYHSQPYLKEFYTRICSAADTITPDYEIIFVNDGSPDHSLEIAVSLHENDRRVRVVDLSRNFGHHKAIMTGLAHTEGKLVFLIDCDLEERPELLAEFYDKFSSSDTDVVYGVQRNRQGGVIKRIAGAAFFKLFNLLSTYPVKPDQTIARLMTRRYVLSLMKHRDHEIYLGGLCALTGFEQIPLTVNKDWKGKSTYSLGRRVSSAVNAITSFSNRPLSLIFYLGCVIILFSTLAALYLVSKWIFFGAYLSGWPSLIVSVWLLGGLTIFCLGVIGIYLSKIFMETKDRPYTIIRKVYGRELD